MPFALPGQVMPNHIGRRNRKVTESHGSDPRSPFNRTIATIGDSIVLQSVGPTVGGYSQQRWNGAAPWARAFSGQRAYLPTANIQGIAGQTTAQILARIPDIIATGAGTVILEGGTNDPVDMDSIGNIAASHAMLRAAGVVVIQQVVIPRPLVDGVYTQAQQDHLISIRDWQRAQHRPSAGIYVSDAWNDIAITPNGVDPKAGMLEADNIHPVPKATYWMGYRDAQVLKQLFTAAKPQDVLGPNKLTAADLAGTTGSKFNGVTGEVATGWIATTGSGALTGDQVILASKVTVDGVVRQRFTINGTWGSAGDLSLNRALANWGTDFNIGDKVTVACETEVSPNPLIRRVSVGATYAAGTNVFDATNSDGEWTDQTATVLLAVERFTLPAAANRMGVDMQLSWKAGTYVNLVVDFWNPYAVKVV
jgi:lysophospholipase L1-like esterase